VLVGVKMLVLLLVHCLRVLRQLGVVQVELLLWGLQVRGE
jgi:hypothetical protein